MFIQKFAQYMIEILSLQNQLNKMMSIYE
jgi:hypothetical protein